MITVNKANPTAAEERTSLVNASDGAGLNFDGSAGNFTGTPPDMGSKFSFELVVSSSDWNASCYFIDFHTGGRFIFGSNGSEIAVYDQTSWKKFGVQILDDNKVHHLCVTIDGTSATLFDNGNQVATQTISTGHNIDSCSALSVGPGGTGTPITMYRCRFYNRTLSADDVRTAFERADVDYSSQYGSQTEKVANSGLENWNMANTVPDDWPTFTAGSSAVARSSDAASGSYSAQLSIDSSNNNVYINTSAVTLPAGKTIRYSVQMKGSAAIDKVAIYALGDNVIIDTPAVTTSYQNFTGTYTATADSRLLIGRFVSGNGASKSIFVDNASVVQIGCVSDYELSANPTQSLTVPDRSGAADCTASTSGVTQVQPVVQLNSTSARIGTTAATPADGEVVADTVSVTGTGHDAAKITITNTSNANARLLLNSGHGNWSVCNSDTIGDALEFRDESAGATRLSINSTGQVQIQQSASDLSGASALKVTGTAYGTNKTIEAYMSTASATKSLIYAENSSGAIFNVRGDGLAEFSGGIAFQSATTGSGTGAGYTLENYEYGTFTMGLSGTTATIPSGYETARYYRIGNLVWISWYSGAMTLASSAGNATLTGLPFNVANNKANYSVFSYTHGNAVDGNSRGGYFVKGDTTMLFIDDGGSAASTFVDGSSRRIMVTGVYETDDA